MYIPVIGSTDQYDLGQWIPEIMKIERLFLDVGQTVRKPRIGPCFAR
jgi:hypothetical protein